MVALDGLTFTVPPGQVFGFLGPNGAGKTTAMRAIVGVVSLESGEVRWRGAPIDLQTRRAFGYMPEERGLYPGMVVLEQLEFLGRLHGMTTSDARDSAGTGPSVWASPTRQRPNWRPSRTATSSACSLPPRWCTIRSCSSWTSRSPGWTRWASMP